MMLFGSARAEANFSRTGLTRNFFAKLILRKSVCNGCVERDTETQDADSENG